MNDHIDETSLLGVEIVDVVPSVDELVLIPFPWSVVLNVQIERMAMFFIFPLHCECVVVERRALDTHFVNECF